MQTLTSRSLASTTKWILPNVVLRFTRKSPTIRMSYNSVISVTHCPKIFDFVRRIRDIALNGMDKDRNIWSQVNRFRTTHGRCADTLFKWNMNSSPNCDCNEVAQTTNHIVNECDTRKLAGGIMELHEVTPDAVQWLQLMDIKLWFSLTKLTKGSIFRPVRST